MKVTDVGYSLEESLVKILEMLCERVSGKNNFQNLILTDGMEGYGKSTLTSGCAYFSSWLLGRELRLYFDLEKLIRDAISQKDLILIWDDAAFASLSIEGYKKVQVKLIKTLMLARKNRHFYFFNIQEVLKMKEMIVARAIGLLHVYSRDQKTIGRFFYANNKQLNYLYETYVRKKKKIYQEIFQQSFAHGTFPNVLYKIFDEEEYNALKDAAILSIDRDEDDSTKLKMEKIMHAFSTYPHGSNVEKAKHAGVDESQIRRWQKKIFKTDNPIKVIDSAFESIINKGYINPKPKRIQETLDK